MRRLAVLIIVALWAQTPSEIGTARIAGTVVAVDGAGAGAGKPSSRAIVTISGSALPLGKSAITDERGQFVLDRLPAGRFTLTATKAAHLRAEYGAARPGRPGVPIVLDAGTQLSNLSLMLAHGAAIDGTIRDVSGLPIAAIVVTAFRVTPAGTLVSAGTAASDDRGHYRVFGLAPGDYLISAARGSAIGMGEVTELASDQIDRKLAALRARRPSAPAAAPAPTPAPAMTSSFVPVFHPHAFSAADATPLSLKIGEERAGVDILLDRARSVSVDGTVTGAPAGSALMITMTQPGALQQTPLTSPTLRNRAAGDGPFQFTNVTPGRYTITARTPIGARPVLFAQSNVDVTGTDLRGISLTMQPALRLSGRIVFDRTRLTPPADLSTITVMVEDAAPQPASGPGGGGRGSGPGSNSTTDARGNFVVEGVLPGLYRLATSLVSDSNGWWLRSAVVNGRDVLDTPLPIEATTPLSGAVLTFSDRHTQLSGNVEVPAGRGASDYFIVVFPDDKTMWLPRARRIRSTRAGTDGNYVIRDLPPGSYRLAALTDVAPDDLADRAFLDALFPASLALTLSDGEQKVQAIRVGG